MPRSPFAQSPGGMLNKAWVEPVFFELRRDDFGRMLVGAEIFDRLEPAFGGRRKAVEKPDFLKDKAQIGGEFRHEQCSPAAGARLTCRLSLQPVQRTASSPAGGKAREAR